MEILNISDKGRMLHHLLVVEFNMCVEPLLANFWKIFEIVLLENSSNRQMENSGASHRPFYRKTHPDQMLHIIYAFVQKFERMSFPVKRSVWRPRIGEILFSTKCFLLDEFSSKTACVTPQNSPFDDWMSFPLKRSRWRLGFFKNWIGTQDFLMDEFSSKTASEMSQKFANKG